MEGRSSSNSQQTFVPFPSLLVEDVEVAVKKESEGPAKLLGYRGYWSSRPGYLAAYLKNGEYYL